MYVKRYRLVLCQITTFQINRQRSIFKYNSGINPENDFGLQQIQINAIIHG